MQKIKDILLIVIIIVWSIMMFRPSRTNHTPQTFAHLHTDIDRPDTFIGYWDRGMLHLQVATYHDEDVDTVAEENQ